MFNFVKEESGWVVKLGEALIASCRSAGGRRITGYPPGLRENGGQCTHAKFASVIIGLIYWMLSPTFS
jgi:cellobiose phosphorylase